MCKLSIASLEHLAHGGVIVPASNAVNVVASVLGALHLVAFKHNTGGLRRLSGCVGNVETLDAQRLQISLGQIECLRQRACSGLLRALFGQQACQLQRHVGLCHFEPGAALLAGLMDHCHSV